MGGFELILGAITVVGAIAFIIGLVFFLGKATKEKVDNGYGYGGTFVLVRKKRGLEDVKNGEIIRVHSSGYVFNAKVINNMPSEEKMLFQMMYSDSSGRCFGEEVARYDSSTFKEFNVLNVFDENTPKKEVEIGEKYFYNAVFDLYEQAINNQKNEEASILREAISKIESIKP